MTLSRRALLIAAATSCLPLPSGRARGDYLWRGYALGAAAELRFSGISQALAASAAAEVMDEVERLEDSFSLYRPESELSRLNRDAALLHPSHDFRLLMEAGLGYWEGTGGAFNPSVQPLWRFLARHFATSLSAPPENELRKTLQLCRAENISLGAGRIALAPGMALTFNGIAQGYIADRAAAIIESRGLSDVLVDMGEIRAVKGKSWRVAAAGAGRTISLAGGAVAQSAGAGTPLSPDGRWHHLIDPATGHSANDLRSVSVEAATATAADALSTALYVATPGERRRIAARYPSIRVWPQPALDEGQGLAQPNPVE